MRPFNFQLFFKRLCPFLLCVFLIVLSLSPLHFLPYCPYAVSWIMIPIFYFAIYNPKFLSAWAVLILGIFSEFFIQSPLGVITFCVVLLFFMTNILRKYFLERTFWPLWGIFAAYLLFILLIEYILVVLLAKYPVTFMPVMIEFWILVLMYPFGMRFCAYIDRKIREAS